jgi:predicted DNA-binding transcriptional regulator AlpA
VELVGSRGDGNWRVGRKVMTEKILVPDKEAAAMLSMGRSTFWREVAKGVLPQPIKIGGLTRWRVSDLQQTCAQQVGASAKA